jgi:dihydropteroate synthase|uniref:dihydropteroate synthase n=1 Tax=Candidatus Planktophila sp. TaxID=2175601 RepID=UPI00404B9A87
MLVMGILNVTPDSFSDGGQFDSSTAAVARGLEMVAEGADIIDIGGESTRPGAQRTSQEQELKRTIPVIKALAEQGVVVSIDTMRAEVARAAVEAGATYINDVSGGIADAEMHRTAAELGVNYILMHWRGHSLDMNTKATYSDVVAEVKAELSQQIIKALTAGITPEKLLIDPGLGFAKDTDHNWELLKRIDEIVDLGYPVLIGASRKRFLGGDSPLERDEATLDVTKGLIGKGIWGVRVHVVAAHKEVISHV